MKPWFIWWFLFLKIEYSTEHGIGRWKTSGFLLAWRDCHNVWSEWNCGFWLTVADRNRQDEHNGWFNFSITLKIESSTEHDVGRRQNERDSIRLGDYHNVWSDLNCGYWLIAAYRTRKYELNGWSDVFLTLTIEYRTENDVRRRQNKRVSISLGGLP